MLHTMGTQVDQPFVAAVLAVLLGFYSAGAWADRTPALVALGAGLAAFWTQDTLSGNPATEYFASAVLVVGSWGGGRALRATRARNRQLEELTVQLADEREARARDAVLVERARIAREMHDVVGHSLSVISLQAQAASAALDRNPALVRAPLAAINDASRSAMVELRRLVAMLDADDEDPTEPLPALSTLSELVAEHRATGLAVSLGMGAVPDGVPPGVQLAAYRIIQEGLTNVRRHSACREARITVDFTSERACVEVADRGPGAASPISGGHGLVGVRARAEACGGWAEAGPDGPGWALRAVLPYDAAPA
jgi:signal transduction histidine kinase